MLTTSDTHRLLKEQIHAAKLGELAVQLKLITLADLEKALKIQQSSRPLGEILCEQGYVTPLDLGYVLKKYKKETKLGQCLLKLGYLSEDDIHAALKEQAQTRGSLGEILVQQKKITQVQLQEALSRQVNIPFEHLANFSYTEATKKKLAGIISQKYAEQNLMLPISLQDKELTVAFFDPGNVDRARELREIYTSFSLRCILVTREKFAELFEVLYSRKLGRHLVDDNFPSSESEVEIDTPPDDFMHIEVDENIDSEKDSISYSTKDIEAEEIVNFILKYGIMNSASDIHIEHDRTGVKLRYRIDGTLRGNNIKWLTKKINQKANAIVSRIKILSNLDISEKRLPQDGVFRINYYDKTTNKKCDLDFRVATCRAINGENVTIRILDSRKASVGLGNLGLSSELLEQFKCRLKSSAGLVLVTGPTGSGKTSTLYGALQYVYNPNLKVITAEDPIEFSFPGIMQTQVNQKINLDFARLLRSFLRLDPDVILVGEIRDEETAKISLDAAQTGHLVLSTLHTNDSIGAISRLKDLQIEQAQISSCLSCVMAQRLVRRICPACIEDHIPAEDEWRVLFSDYPSNYKFYHGKGCDNCDFTGFTGRTILAELFVSDVLKTIADLSDIGVIRQLARAHGMKTILDDGLTKLKETTLAEIIRVSPYEMIQAHHNQNNSNPLRQGKTPLPDKLSDGFCLSDPANEQDVINRIHRQYEKVLTTATVKPQTHLNRDLFWKFIEESFHTIKKEHRCRSIYFFIDNCDGRIDISAVPGNF